MPVNHYSRGMIEWQEGMSRVCGSDPLSRERFCTLSDRSNELVRHCVLGWYVAAEHPVCAPVERWNGHWGLIPASWVGDALEQQSLILWNGILYSTDHPSIVPVTTSEEERRFVHRDDPYLQDECAQCDNCEAWGEAGTLNHPVNIESGDITRQSFCEECYRENQAERDRYVDQEEAEREASEEEEERSVIRDYHQAKGERLGFFARHDEPRIQSRPIRYFGVEVEVECDKDENIHSDAEGRYHYFEERCVFTTDGSLSNGYEIISAPMTLLAHQAWWSSLNKKAFRFLSGHNDTCGIHVHVSRNAVTDLTIAKVADFLADESKREFVDCIAQRPSNDFCFRLKGATFAKPYDEKRYSALNLRNKNTIEFRIFRGNTRPERILKNIEFCDAILSWAEATSIKQLTVDSFLSWLNSNRGTYKNLVRFLVDKSYLKKIHKAQSDITEDAA